MVLVENKKCPGCKACFVQNETDISHSYIGANPECWEMYGKILVKEFENPDYFKVHRITADTYGAQHIGDQADRRARQSANVHLIALYLTVGELEDPRKVLEFLKEATRVKRDWPALSQRQAPKWMTVKDIIEAHTAEEHGLLVKKWGQSVWNEYSDIHSSIKDLYIKGRS
jgi:hypothetical protein